MIQRYERCIEIRGQRVAVFKCTCPSTGLIVQEDEGRVRVQLHHDWMIKGAPNFRHRDVRSRIRSVWGKHRGKEHHQEWRRSLSIHPQPLAQPGCIRPPIMMHALEDGAFSTPSLLQQPMPNSRFALSQLACEQAQQPLRSLQSLQPVQPVQSWPSLDVQRATPLWAVAMPQSQPTVSWMQSALPQLALAPSLWSAKDQQERSRLMSFEPPGKRIKAVNSTHNRPFYAHVLTICDCTSDEFAS